MSLVAFTLATRSITLAGVMSAAVAVGMMLSPLLRNVHPKVFSVVMLATRIAAVYFAYRGFAPLAILAAALAGLSSRRLFLDLKHRVGAIDPTHLVTHGARNSIGFGLGAAAAGLLVSHPTIAQLVAALVGVVAFFVYPDSERHDVEEASGLTKSDLVASVVFSFSMTPLSNGVAPIILLAVVGPEVAGLSCLGYTLGSLLSSKLAKYLYRSEQSVAIATAAAGLVFMFMLSMPSGPVVIPARSVTGALLFAAQGILEMRSHREGSDGRGLEHLWTMLSAAGVVANLAIPFAVDNTTLWSAPAITLIGALAIATLNRRPLPGRGL